MSYTNPSVGILQWNCRSAVRRLPEICYMLEEHKINIATLYETRLDKYVQPTFVNHVIISKNRNRQPSKHEYITVTLS